MDNLGDILDAVAEVVAPDAPAFIHGDVTVPWNVASARMRAIAGSLSALGLSRGDKIAFYLRNGLEYGELTGACFLAGFVHVNVNYRYLPEEVLYILDNSDAAVVVFAAEFRGAIEAIRDRLGKVRRFVEVGPESEIANFASPYATLTEARAFKEASPRSPEDQVFVYTGGTTGLPKGVMYRHGDLGPYLLAVSGLFGASPPTTLSDVQAMIRARGGAGARYMPACPQMHGTGFFVTMWTMLTGGCVVTVDNANFDPHAVWRAAETHRVTNIAIVGDPFARPLLRALEEQPGRYDLSSLISIGSSGAMWSEEVKRGLLRAIPHISLNDVFASSETFGMGVSISSNGAAAATAKFVQGPNAILIDEEDRPIPPGSGLPGRVAVAGMQPIGYYKDPEKTARTFKTIAGKRYSIPGDYATQAADGSLILLGRGNHCINTAGEKVFPEEVEEALKNHPDVEDALVLGLPHEIWGQAVTAVVRLVPAAVADEANLREHARARLASYKSPKRVFISTRAFRAPNGKADYRAASEFARACIGAAIDGEGS